MGSSRGFGIARSLRFLRPGHRVRHWHVTFLVAVLVLALSPLACTTRSAGPGTIFFASRRYGGWDILTMTGDGANESRPSTALRLPLSFWATCGVSVRARRAVINCRLAYPLFAAS